MRRSHVAIALAGAFWVACWGGERTRPHAPTPARAPFAPSLPIPSAPTERPPPPPAPASAIAGRTAGQPAFEAETAPDLDPPAGQLGGGDATHENGKTP